MPEWVRVSTAYRIVSARMEISERTFRNWVYNGVVASKRVGGLVLVDRVSLDGLIEKESPSE